MKVRLFLTWRKFFTFDQRVHKRSAFVAPTGRSNLCRFKAGDETFPGFSWASHGSDVITGFTAVHSGGDSGARLQVSSAENQRRRSEMWECSSVREKWSEVNRKRLIYTAVITLVFSYPRREEGRQEEEKKVMLEDQDGKMEAFCSLVVKVQKQEDGQRRQTKVR